MSFNSFDEVVAWYNKTPVVRSAWGKAHDIRPVGDRNRPWERIIKIADNCYVLSDGWHAGVLDVYRERHKAANVTSPVLDVEETLAHAPIIWRRGADGAETLEVRNCGWRSNSPNSRRPFLTAKLPKEMWVSNNRDGFHTLRIKQGSGDRDIYLPKVTYKHNESLAFARGSDGFWELPENARPVPVRRVNIEAKKSYRAAIWEFDKWARLMLPMLPINDHQASAEAINKIGFGWLAGSGTRGVADPELIRTILLDPDHPQRVDLAMALYAVQVSHIERRTRAIPKNLTRPLNKWCGWETIQQRIF